MGIGDYDLVEKSETVMINGRSYQANGYRVHERDEFATFRSEFFSVAMRFMKRQPVKMRFCRRLTSGPILLSWTWVCPVWMGLK
jgi:hypothetical protein